MKKLASEFSNFLRVRLNVNVHTTERDITYTFFASLVKFGYYEPHEILLEYDHPRGGKVDTYIPSNNGKNGLVMECKYDRRIPSNNSSPKTQKAGKIFNDLFRLASFANEQNVIKWFIYLTDDEMMGYFNNPANNLYDFFNLAQGSVLIIDNDYLNSKPQTFIKQITIYDIDKINITCVFDSNLPASHKIKIFEVAGV
jgi:hypothetical protein